MKPVSILLALFVALVSVTNAFTPFRPAVQANQCASVASTTELYGVCKVKIEVGDGEPIEGALRRFKRETNKSGHLMELRHRRYFENSQERKKRKIKEGRLRKKFERMARRRKFNQQ